MDESRSPIERRILFLVGKIENNGDIPDANKRAAQAWTHFLRARGISPKTIAKHLYCFERFLIFLPKGVTLKKAAKEDIETAVAAIEATDYAPETKHVMKVVVKAFYKHYLGEDDYYPRQVAWIKTTFSKGKRLLPEDILGEAEVLKMIKAVSSPRDKAMIALLYDSGIRVGELLGMRIKSVDLSGDPAHVLVNGKTGMRKIPIYFSAPYLASYVTTLQDKKNDDYLWTAMGTWSGKNRPIVESGVSKVLKEAGEKAKIGKRIYPHLFRHSRATYYANRLTEQQLKVFFGWTGDSKMASNYVHLSGRDIDDAVMQVYGKKAKEEVAPQLTVKICPRCRYENGMDFLHCRQCGAPLDVRTAQKGQEVVTSLWEAILENAKDPEFQKDMIRALGKKRKRDSGE